MNQNFLGSRIRELRILNKVTQIEVANVLGLSDSLVCKLERGKYPLNTDKLLKLSEYFGVSTDYLLGRQRIITIYEANTNEVLVMVSETKVVEKDGYKAEISHEST